jgi:hypothetical protein
MRDRVPSLLIKPFLSISVILLIVLNRFDHWLLVTLAVTLVAVLVASLVLQEVHRPFY